MVNVGILGAGRIAGVHASIVTSHEDSHLAAVSDFFPEAAEKLATAYGAKARTTDEIISDPEIDAVIIATPTDTHSDLIEAATAAGKAVLCEKPVDLSLERARACKAVTDSTGQPVMIGFNRRFDPSFSALKHALSSGEIGKTEMLSITSFDPAPPPISYVETSGGMYRDMMIHDFDLTNFIMQDSPITVIAQGSSLVDPEIGNAGDVDTAIVTMRFADGRLAVIRNSRRAAYGYDQRIEVLGSEGMLQAENMLENSIIKSTAAGVTSAKPVHFFLERYLPAFHAEWAGFMAALKDGTKMPVTLDDGIAALALAEAATRSSQTGLPVHLSDL